MYRILSISRDTRLLLARNEALTVAGFQVVSSSAPHSAAHALLSENIDAVVLGHSVPRGKRQLIIRRIRQLDPCCPIFFVYEQPHTTGEPLADLSIDVTEGARALVNELTGGRANARKQAAAAACVPSAIAG